MSAAPLTRNPERRVEGIVPEGRLLGIVFLAIAGLLAAGFVAPEVGRYVPMAVSGTLLAAFALSREYGFAIPSGIIGGVGTAVLFITEATLGPAATPQVLFLSIAGGFGAVWILGLLAEPREVHPWPLVPATILGALGIALAAGQPGAIDWIQGSVAAVLALAGVARILRRKDHDR